MKFIVASCTQIVGVSKALQQHSERKHKMVTLKHTNKVITKRKL
jgi:hypothetical protein